MSNNKIALTASMRSNLLSLQNTQNLMNKTQDRLSTGYKVNSAMDNPSSFFTAQALNSRANDLSSLLDSIGQAISTLEVADEGITTLQSFVEQAKAIANSARDTSNVSAKSTSKVKFDTNALRSELVTDQVNGLTGGKSTMTIRLGDATKLDGTTNVSGATDLSRLNLGNTNTTDAATDIGTLSVGSTSYTINASGTTKQMTNVSSYGEESVLKITDIADPTKASVEDAAGNKYTLDLSGITGIDGAINAKQIKVRSGMEGAIEATISEDGKTTWKLTDKEAWHAPAEMTKVSTWDAGDVFKVNVDAAGKATLSTDAGGVDLVSDAATKDTFGGVKLKTGDLVYTKTGLSITSKGDEDGNYESQDVDASYQNAINGGIVNRTAVGFVATDGTDFEQDYTSDPVVNKFAAGSVFKVTAVGGNSITLTDDSGNDVAVAVTDSTRLEEIFTGTLAGNDLIQINADMYVKCEDDGSGSATILTFVKNQAGAAAAATDGDALFNGTLLVKATDAGSSVHAVTADTVENSTPDPVVSDRPTEDLKGTARDINGTFTYDTTGTGASFKVSDLDTTGAKKTATLTDKNGNAFRNVDITDAYAASVGALPAHAIENGGIVTFTGGTTLSLSKAENDIVVAQVDQDGTRTTGTNGDRTGDADASGTFVEANTVYIDNGGTVAEMAETLQNMIGNTKISVTVEDSNLKIKSLDTSAIQVKDGACLGKDSTGTPGVGFATAFGLDQGQTITLDASDTAESLRQKIAGMSQNMRDGREVTAEFDTNGHIVIKSSEGDDMVISGELAERLGVSGSATNGANERATYSQQFNDVLAQIDQLVQDTSYKGINLLKGDNLTVNFNESRTSTIELKGVTFDATGLGFTQAQNEWKTNANIDESLEQITKATSMLRAQASEFGQNLSTVQIREDFTKNMINNLQSGADKLVLADMNEEGANMLALQTRQQLGVNSLSLASQASQSVLRLF